jgi:hypothetical protein
MSTDEQGKDKTGSRPSRRQFVQLGAVAVSGGLLAACGGGGDAGNAALLESGKVTKISTPTIECAGSTQASINIKVTAGATGAPAGFSLQWMTLAAYEANGNAWYASDDTRLCKGSFSGNANDSRYSLTAGQFVTVNVGELLFDNGTSTNCAGALECGTAYVFRAFAHATSTLQRSDFTGNLSGSTLVCGSTGACTFTQGYWKTHGPVPTGNNTNVWPVTSLMLGTVNYTDLQLQSILDTPASGNGLITLAHQLIAAKLNIANGANGSAIAASISTADTLIGGLVIPPVGSGSLLPADTSALVTALTAYNEGATGPGHCS